MKTLTTISLALAVAAAGAQTTSQSKIRHIETSLNHLTVLEFGEPVATLAIADRDNSCVHSPNSSVLNQRVSKGKDRTETTSVAWDQIHAAIVLASSSLRSRTGALAT